MNTSATPIVMAAFGTTSQAMETYSHIDTAVRAAFPGHPVKWAYTSRMVRAHMKKKRNVNMKDPLQVLTDLHAQGHRWAVVQSLHMICGHEFYRLLDDIKASPTRTSIGLPLLTSPEDYRDVAGAIITQSPAANTAATVMVGHGTDHPAWTAYPALAHMLRQHNKNIHIGTVEGEEQMDEIVSAICGNGIQHVHLAPLMLVAGVHLQEDIAGDEDSWKCAFEAKGVEVSVATQGMGELTEVVDIFIRHIGEAMEMVLHR